MMQSATGEDGKLTVQDAERHVGKARRDLETASLMAESRRAAAKTEVAKALEQQAEAEMGAAGQFAAAEKDAAAAMRQEAAARLAAAQAEDSDSPAGPEATATRRQ